MTNREWILATLSHKETGPVPYNFMFSPPIEAALKKHYGVEDVVEYLDFPIRMSAPNSPKPLYAHPSKFGATVTDEFGVVWSTSEIDRGSPIGPCLREPGLTCYRFPDPRKPGRFDGLREFCESNREHYTVIWVGDLWERATFMRGMEDLLLDLSANPAFAAGLLRRLTDYILETMTVLFDTLTFDAIAISDDYGAQRSMLMSPDTWRKTIKPVLSEIYSFARQNNRQIFHHTCGHVTPIIPDLIDIGLDILHPIQPEAMDIHQLKQDFGQHLTFCGGIRTQDFLPNATPEEVRAEVRHLKETMGRGGGYILEPGITLQADVPVENVVAMVDEVRGISITDR